MSFRRQEVKGVVSLLVLVTYDVSTMTPAGRARLRKVAKCCIAHGQRVQNSVFECSLDEAQFVGFKAQLTELIDKSTDSLRFYNLGNKYRSKVIHIGNKETYYPDDDLIL